MPFSAKYDRIFSQVLWERLASFLSMNEPSGEGLKASAGNDVKKPATTIAQNRKALFKDFSLTQHSPFRKKRILFFRLTRYLALGKGRPY
jgi:hypothetical protein